MRKEYILFMSLLRRFAALHTSTDICLTHVFEIASGNFHVQASRIVHLFCFRIFLSGSGLASLFEKTHIMLVVNNFKLLFLAKKLTNPEKCDIITQA